MTTMTRGQFLRGDLAGRRTPLRPPWSVAEAAFQRACTRCDACIGACAAGLLRRGRGGYPEVAFELAGCTFCGACAEACRSGAILPRDARPAWSLSARIESVCLALAGVVCRSCGEFCESRAIRFTVRPRGVAVPVVDAAACTGCGACVAPCPAGAVRVTEPAPRAAAA